MCKKCIIVSHHCILYEFTLDFECDGGQQCCVLFFDYALCFSSVCLTYLIMRVCPQWLMNTFWLNEWKLNEHWHEASAHSFRHHATWSGPQEPLLYLTAPPPPTSCILTLVKLIGDVPPEITTNMASCMLTTVVCHLVLSSEVQWCFAISFYL